MHLGINLVSFMQILHLITMTELLNLGCIWSADPDISQIYCNFTMKPEYSLSSLDTWDYMYFIYIKTWQQSFCTGSSCDSSSDSWPQPGRLISQDLTSDWTVSVRLDITYRHFQYDIRALVNQHSSLAWVYLNSSVTVLFVCWTGRSLSRMSILNCSLFY